MSRGRTREVAERLTDVPLFGRCTKGDLRIVARHVELLDASEGTVIVRQGQEGDAFFLILEGAAYVQRDGVTVAKLGPGDWFGELALLDPAPRAATVTASEDCQLAVLGVRMFRVVLRELPGLSAGLLGNLAARLRQASGPDAASH